MDVLRRDDMTVLSRDREAIRTGHNKQRAILRLNGAHLRCMRYWQLARVRIARGMMREVHL